MKILGIETSCDETAAAVVEDGTKILSNVVASSSEMHTKTGGIIPEQAAREQIRSIIPVINEALLTTSTQNLVPNIDAIAVTVGPGLIGSLLVGVETAKTLAYVWNKPIIPVNHLVAHVYANWLTSSKHREGGPEFPALALVVSGGHTDLVLMRNHGDLVWIGGTRDDAAGEAFDKTARLLGLPYPGGPSISNAAEKYINNKLQLFPRPLIDDDNFDWSFSGLKTAVFREASDRGSRPVRDRGRLAAEIQEAIVDVLVDKTMKAVNKYQPKSLLISGGVAANKRLREKFDKEFRENNLKTELYIPELKLCTDNGAVIACAAYYNYKEIPWKNISTNPELTISDYF